MKTKLYVCLMWVQFDQYQGPRLIPTILLFDTSPYGSTNLSVIQIFYRIPNESLFEFKIRVTKEIKRKYSDWVIVTENFEV